MKICGVLPAAIGITQRQGLGKVRHLAVADLWIQDAVKSGIIKLSRVEGEKNPADILTKYVEAYLLARHCTECHVVSYAGRAELAPKV